MDVALLLWALNSIVIAVQVASRDGVRNLSLLLVLGLHLHLRRVPGRRPDALGARG